MYWITLFTLCLCLVSCGKEIELTAEEQAKLDKEFNALQIRFLEIEVGEAKRRLALAIQEPEDAKKYGLPYEKDFDFDAYMKRLDEKLDKEYRLLKKANNESNSTKEK